MIRPNEIAIVIKTLEKELKLKRIPTWKEFVAKRNELFPKVGRSLTEKIEFHKLTS